MSETDVLKAELADIRSDPTKTAARYDEIIALRMFLLDIKEELSKDNDPLIQRVRRDILRRARTWGKEGDCV